MHLFSIHQWNINIHIWVIYLIWIAMHSSHYLMRPFSKVETRRSCYTHYCISDTYPCSSFSLTLLHNYRLCSLSMILRIIWIAMLSSNYLKRPFSKVETLRSCYTHPHCSTRLCHDHTNIYHSLVVFCRDLAVPCGFWGFKRTYYSIFVVFIFSRLHWLLSSEQVLISLNMTTTTVNLLDQHQEVVTSSLL